MEWNAHSLSIHKLLDFHLLVPPGLHLLLLLLFLLTLILLLAVETLFTADIRWSVCVDPLQSKC